MVDTFSEVAAPQNPLTSATTEILWTQRAVLPHLGAGGGPLRGGMQILGAVLPVDTNARLGSPENLCLARSKTSQEWSF
jgi:hypothetical protein